MVKKTIEQLLGTHYKKNSFFSDWLIPEDIPPPTNNTDRKIRKLTCNKKFSKSAISNISQLIVKHHLPSPLVDELKDVRKEIYEKYGLYEKYKLHVDSQEYLTQLDTTARVGNFAEIILTEYIQALGNFQSFIYKLHYNPNTSQSMKGDDLLLFNRKNLKESILMGESKFRRSRPSSDVVEEILGSFSEQSKMPISITFVANVIRNKNPELARQLSYLQVDMKDGKIPIFNIGFLFSDSSASTPIEKHDFYLDYQLNQKVFDELQKLSYPVAFIQNLEGSKFKTRSKLIDEIKKELYKGFKNDPNITNKQTAVKQWMNSKYKKIILKYSDKSRNPNMIFMSIGIENPKDLVDKCFKEADKLLYNPNQITKTA